MNKPRNTEDRIGRTVMAYLGQHFHEDLTLSDIAAALGYSSSWVGLLFKKETGQSVWSYLTQIRINEAMKQLLATKLNITQIAYNVGFNDFSRFSVAFKKKTGTTPRAFRKDAALKGEAPVLIEDDIVPQTGLVRFRDFFSGPELLPCWNRDAGHWKQDNGILHGKNDEELRLTFLDPIPENFALSFDFRFVADTHLVVTLHGGRASDFYLKTAVGKHENKISEVDLPNANHSWNEQARIIPGTWQNFRLEVVDDSIRILLDEQEIFHCKDPFPPAYSLRSRFSIGGWQSSVEIKGLTIHDHGFLPLVPAVRQADALYSNAMYQRALNAYMRLLGSAIGPAEIMELQYKIGMCFLQQNSPIQARLWLEKIAPWPQNPFWYDQARIGLLETDRICRDYSQFLERAALLFPNSGLRDLVRSSFEKAVSDCCREGFFDQALGCQAALCGHESPGSLLHYVSKAKMASLLLDSRKHEEAISCCYQVVDLTNAPASLRNQVLLTLSQVLTSEGRTEESDKVLDGIRAKPGNNYLAARRDLGRGSNMRVRRKFREAVDFLSNLPNLYSDAPDSCAFGLLLASQICCQLHDPNRARELFQLAQKMFSESVLLVGYYGGMFRYPPLFVEGKFAEAAKVLLDASELVGEAWLRADHIVRAGILFELADKKAEALSAWKDVTLRFPPEHCCFYTSAAEAFIAGNLDILETMPLGAIHRAEMFYLAGVLSDKRGHLRQSSKFFNLCVAEDRSLNWFTCLAAEEIARRDQSE